MPEAAAVWRNLATVRSWLGDRPGAAEALHRYAALDVPQDDAVEAEWTAMLLGDDPLGDRVELVKLTWTVRDAERFQEALQGESRAVQLPFNPASLAGEDTPPPRAIFLLLDRPLPASAEGLTMDAMPAVLGQAFLFGRQTDREARLETIGVAADDVATICTMVEGLAGETIEPQPQRELLSKTSASHELMQRKWYPPRDVAPEQLVELANQHLRLALLQQWPALPLGIFAGKTPREAAGDPRNGSSCWPPFCSWSRGAKNRRCSSTSINCATRWACRASHRSIRSRCPWPRCRWCVCGAW